LFGILLPSTERETPTEGVFMLPSAALAREFPAFDIHDGGRAALRASSVRERPNRYEDEGSIREARGSASVGRSAWWSVALVVQARPDELGDVGGEEHALVRLERHGVMPAGAAVDAQSVLVVPSSELDTLVALLAGVIAQARRDGVLDGPA
jgi:hypothetical protein